MDSRNARHSHFGGIFELPLSQTGSPASRASRRAISVLADSVGPIIKIFFGRMSSAMRWQFLPPTDYHATATARFAAFWPTIYLSSSATIARASYHPAPAELSLRRVSPVGNRSAGHQ